MYYKGRCSSEVMFHISLALHHPHNTSSGHYFFNYFLWILGTQGLLTVVPPFQPSLSCGVYFIQITFKDSIQEICFYLFFSEGRGGIQPSQYRENQNFIKFFKIYQWKMSGMLCVKAFPSNYIILFYIIIISVLVTHSTPN